MARSRDDLHNILLGICPNVYYQPPGENEMKYTAIKYHKKSMDTKYANNKIYASMNCYEVIVIAREPEDPVNEKVLELPYCSYDNNYRSDNLEHDVYTLYY